MGTEIFAIQGDDNILNHWIFVIGRPNGVIANSIAASDLWILKMSHLPVRLADEHKECPTV